jgi:hypothetical protein
VTWRYSGERDCSPLHARLWNSSINHWLLHVAVVIDTDGRTSAAPTLLPARTALLTIMSMSYSFVIAYPIFTTSHRRDWISVTRLVGPSLGGGGGCILVKLFLFDRRYWHKIERRWTDERRRRAAAALPTPPLPSDHHHLEAGQSNPKLFKCNRVHNLYLPTSWSIFDHWPRATKLECGEQLTGLESICLQYYSPLFLLSMLPLSSIRWKLFFFNFIRI